MKGPSEPAAHIVLIEGQRNMDSFVGDAHTVSAGALQEMQQ